MNVAIEVMTNTADKKSLAFGLMSEWGVNPSEIMNVKNSITLWTMDNLSDSAQKMIAYDYLSLTDCNTVKEAVIEIASFI